MLSNLTKAAVVDSSLNRGHLKLDSALIQANFRKLIHAIPDSITLFLFKIQIDISLPLSLPFCLSCNCIFWRDWPVYLEVFSLGIRKWLPTPTFLPGKSHGQRSLAGYSLRGLRVGHDWAHTHTPHRLGITFHLIPHEIHEIIIRTRKHSFILSTCRGVFLHSEVREAAELTNAYRKDQWMVLQFP